MEGISHHDEVHAALVAESADELSVLRVVAVLGQAAEAGGSAVERLSAPEERQQRQHQKNIKNKIASFIGT